MYTINEILVFIEEEIGEDNIQADTDINEDLGGYGDDFHELIENYSKKFSVDIGNYLWYFHTQEEGQNFIGGSFFKPPNERVARIPVTPNMLLEFTNKGKWDLSYPKHTIPSKRYDLLINTIVVVIALIFSIAFIIYKYLL